MVGATWQDYQQFPWILFMAVILPAELIIVIAAGGPHEASGESWVWVATFLLATLMWYGLIEGARAGGGAVPSAITSLIDDSLEGIAAHRSSVVEQGRV